MTSGDTSVIGPCSVTKFSCTNGNPAAHRYRTRPTGTPPYFITHRGVPAVDNLWSVPQGLRTGVPPRARSTT
jgi:hypothetical protein